ncbi:MAG TPA: succinate dehydrogenase assembly factor 2 [Steroidobacteraceae bacterium]|nr:succinate dehydrogenase assembly factor 2 [Steroidobacteraceae bacterium]
MTTQNLALLRWRCRRGMRELDVLLERYLRERYPSAPAAEQQAFEALLDLPDPELLAFVMQRQVPADAHWAHVISKLTDPDA